MNFNNFYIDYFSLLLFIFDYIINKLFILYLSFIFQHFFHYYVELIVERTIDLKNRLKKDVLKEKVAVLARQKGRIGRKGLNF